MLENAPPCRSCAWAIGILLKIDKVDIACLYAREAEFMSTSRATKEYRMSVYLRQYDRQFGPGFRRLMQHSITYLRPKYETIYIYLPL